MKTIRRIIDWIKSLFAKKNKLSHGAAKRIYHTNNGNILCRFNSRTTQRQRRKIQRRLA
jgi:hypothetical protein